MGKRIGSYFGWLGRKARRPRLHTRVPRLRHSGVEGLEGRQMLAADLGMLPGDSNLNGTFDSTDIVQVFQAGKFESGVAAGWSEGDWNGDGMFNTTDIVFAFQSGNYDVAKLAAADAVAEAGSAETASEDTTTDDTSVDSDDSLDGSGDEGATDDGVTDDGATDDGTTDDGDDCLLDAGERHGAGMGGLRMGHDRDRSESRIAQLIESLSEQIANQEELPGSLTTEEAQAIVDGLTAALESGDTESLRDLLGQLRSAHQEDRLQAQIDRLNEILASDDPLPGDLVREDVQAAVQSAAESLAAGDLEATQEALRTIYGDFREARHDEAQDVALQTRIDRLQAAIDDGTLPDHLSVEQAQALIAAYTTAIETGDLAVVHEANQLIHLQNLLADLNGAVAAEEGYRSLTAEETASLATSLSEALANNDLAAAQALVDSLRPDRSQGGPGHGGPGHGRPGHGHHPHAPTDEDSDQDTDEGDSDDSDSAGEETENSGADDVGGTESEDSVREGMSAREAFAAAMLQRIREAAARGQRR